MWIYASKYLGDVKGLIGMDGGGIKDYPDENTIILSEMTEQEIQEATAEYYAAVQVFQENGTLLSEVSGYEMGQFGSAVPKSRSLVGFESIADYIAYYRSTHPWAGPPPYPLENITDVSAYTSYYTWGEGMVTNVFTPYPGGDGETYMDPDALILGRGEYTRYWPNIQNMETNENFGGGGLNAYDDCPFLDYDDHWQEIDVPVLSFNGELSCRGGCQSTSIEYTLNNLETNDTTLYYLPNYGHLDVYYGTHSREDMKEPMLDWMDMHQ